MSVWHTGPGGFRAEHNGVVTADSGGTAITPGTGGMGSYVQLVAATSFPYQAVVVFIGQASANDYSGVIDIAIGAAASEQIVAENIWFSFADQFNMTIRHYPLFIPGGSRIAARCSSDLTGALDISILGMEGGHHFPYGVSRIKTYGVTSIDNADGTDIDAGATANTKGSWVQIVASSDELDGFNFTMANSKNPSLTEGAHAFDIGIGGAGSEQVIIPDLLAPTDSTADMPLPESYGPIRYKIPSGTRIAVRNQCTTSNPADRVLDVTVEGFIR